MRRVGDEWKLQETTTKLALSADPAPSAVVQTLSVWNVAIKPATTVPVFPGAVQVGSTNPNIAISAPTKPLLLESLTAPPGPALSFAPTLTDVGRKAVYDAIDSWGRYCFHGDTPPPDCPNTHGSANIVPGTVSISGSGDFGDVTTAFDTGTLSVAVTGIVRWPASANVTSGTPSFTFPASIQAGLI